MMTTPLPIKKSKLNLDDSLILARAFIFNKAIETFCWGHGSVQKQVLPYWAIMRLLS